MELFSSYPDSALVEQIRKHDQQAFEALYKRYWQQLFDAAYRRLKDFDTCKDLVQNVFADLWRRRAVVEIADLAAYLHTAIRFQVFKNLSRSRKATPFSQVYEQLSQSAFTIDNTLVQKELRELALAWLESLPAKRKAILQLYLFDHLGTQEIAERLGVSRKTVQNQLGLAVREFDQDLGLLVILLMAFLPPHH